MQTPSRPHRAATQTTGLALPWLQPDQQGTQQSPATLSEAWAADGSPRDTWRTLLGHLERVGNNELHSAARETKTLIEDDGVNYTSQRTGATGWSLDPLPYAIGSGEWARLERALTQRLEVFNAILTDAYGPKNLIKRGIIPAHLILGHPGFVRQAADLSVPRDHQLIMSANDIGRDENGRWRALTDRTQTPNGIGFVLENRRIIARTLPGVYRGLSLRRLSDFLETLRTALQGVAARGVESPRVVLLTDGPKSGTTFDHAHLATLLGFPLATAQDLTVHSGKLWLRTVDRLEQVDVVLRRVDAQWSDPLDLRPDSLIGVPGLIDVVRRGHVTVVNPFGAGVIENPALQAYFEQICRATLDEDLLLHPVDTWWLGTPETLSHARAHFDTLVFRNLDRPQRSPYGGSLSRQERDDLLREVTANPQAWVAQALLPLSTTPSLRSAEFEEPTTEPVANSAIDTVATSLVLRTYGCATGSGYEIMAGGLARVSQSPRDLQTDRMQVLVTKDVWVLSGSASQHRSGGELTSIQRPSTVMPLSPRAAEGLYWFGRYIERSEFLVRVQREQFDRRNEFEKLLDDASVRESNAIDRTAAHVISALAHAAVGGPSHMQMLPPAGLQENMIQWMMDERQPGSLAHTFARLLQTARSVRDQMAHSTWPILARMSRSLRTLRQHPEDAMAVVSLQHFLESSLALQGVMNESMVRDDGWNLMDAGRRIERAGNTTALLHYTVGRATSTQADALLVESCLVVGESLITHRRRYSSVPIASHVLELLACDPSNPRSLQFQVRNLEQLHDRLSARSRSRRLEEALQNFHESIEQLDVWQAGVSDASGDRRALTTMTAAVQHDLQEISSALASAYFSKTIAQRPL